MLIILLLRMIITVKIMYIYIISIHDIHNIIRSGRYKYIVRKRREI